MKNEKLNILVVEDKQQHQESARILLGNEHNLRITKTYADTIKALNEGRPDVLLTDMMFPLGDGPTQDRYSEASLGYAIALYAARPYIAVPRIAILTDLNHHSNAVSATFDDFYSLDRKSDEQPKEMAIAEKKCQDFDGKGYFGQGRPVFKINNSYLAMFDSRDLECCGITPNNIILFGNDYQMSGGKAKETKNWKAALEVILKVV